MNARNPPANRRMPSGAWSRLRPSNGDPLETIGLPSKGEIKLNDLETQENYYSQITERYIKFCAASGTRDELERQFSSISMAEQDRGTRPEGKAETLTEKCTSTTMTSELSTILMAMRKLREAIVATNRHDEFAQRAYIFIIRAAILVKHMESYHPAILYLLNNIHRHRSLSASELQEFVGYYILDLACRQRNYMAAYAARHHYRFRDWRVENIINALAHDNWTLFWRMKRGVDGHQRRLVEWAEDGMRRQALKSMAKTYFTVDKTYLEKCAGMAWDDLVRTRQIGWKLEDEVVVIRKPKGR